MAHVQIIMGSVRPHRIGQQISPFILRLAHEVGLPDAEIIDLRDWPLALDDEPDQPSKGVYMQETTRRWSAKIAQADGFVFLSPQYNWSYPAALKNALDHLYREWHGKPALVISYGHRGGGRAATHLQQVLEGLRMKPIAQMPTITFDESMLDSGRLLKQAEADLAPFFPDIKSGLAALKVRLTAETC